MKNFRDNYYEINEHDNNLKFFNSCVAFIDILKTQERINRKGQSVYNNLFSEWEKSYINKLTVPKRRLDFICGRLAAKKAVRKQLLKSGCCKINKNNNLPFYKDMEIRRTVTGRPAVFIKDGKSKNGSSDYYISISHTQEAAAAMVTEKKTCKGIGIDIEKIEERAESFLNIAFTEQEIRNLKEIVKENNVRDSDKYQEEIARYWTIKEAVMKSMGVGVNIDLRDIELIEVLQYSARINLKNEALKRIELLEGNEIQIKHQRMQNFILSQASLL